MTKSNKKLILLSQAVLAAEIILIYAVPHAVDAEEIRWPLLAAFLIADGIYLVGILRNRAKTNVQAESIIILILFSVFVVWELVSSIFGMVSPVLVPSPESVFSVFIEERTLILTGIAQSLLKLVLGISLALVTGTLLGLVIGWIPTLRRVFFPICKVLSPIPPVVYVSYVVALMPTFASASIAVVFLGVFWPTLLSMISSIGGIDEQLIMSTRSMSVSTKDMLFRVILPYSLPALLGNMTVIVTFSFMTLTSAEMIGSTAGLGYFVSKFAAYSMFNKVLCGIITIAIVVTLLNIGIGKLKEKIVVWQ